MGRPMSTQVFYRKWRPQDFGQMVGQGHVTSTLTRAVGRGRVAHSYLFCGPRGTGKTSTARLLAKAVSCSNPNEGDPCGNCLACTAVQEGRFLDLIEMDAASNRGIDEIRSIRDKVALSPVEGRYKIYIIDEAHMLTEHASNAFLKTLEEPPPHAIFILCTTEPHKILPTIISRCQRFDFRRLTSDTIVDRLRVICTQEGVDADPTALKTLAHAAGGSLRDAENMLEQLVVAYGDRLSVSEVNELLGLGHGERALEFVRYLLMSKTSSALAAINEAVWDGVDLRQLHKQVIDLLRALLLIQCGSRDALDLPGETSRDIEDLASKVPTSATMLSLKRMAEVNMKLDAPSPLPLELAVVEISLEKAAEPAPAGAFRPAGQVRSAPKPPAPRAMPSEQGPVSTAPSPEITPAPAPVSEDNSNSEKGASIAPAVSTGAPAPSSMAAVPINGASAGLSADQWSSLIRALSRYKGKRFNIGALLRDCKDQHMDGETLVVAFSHRSHLERMQEELDDPQGMRAVEQAMTKSLGAFYGLKLGLAENAASTGQLATTQSPLVRAALNLGGRILEEREQ